VDVETVAVKEQTEKWFEDGKAARRMGCKKESCPFGFSKGVARGFWLGGWHEQDMELDTKEKRAAE
jgi:ribosome modulation factor